MREEKRQYPVEMKLPKCENNPPEEFKKGEIISGSQINASSTVEYESAYYDPEDDFFKNAQLLDMNDDFEPPPAPRVGGPRKSQALSKKLKARKKAISSNPVKYSYIEQDTVLAKNKGIQMSVKSESSSEFSPKASSGLPRLKLHPSFERNQPGQPGSFGRSKHSPSMEQPTEMLTEGNVVLDEELNLKNNEIAHPSTSQEERFSNDIWAPRHVTDESLPEIKQDMELEDNTSKVAGIVNNVYERNKNQDLKNSSSENIKYPSESLPQYETMRKLRKKNDHKNSVYELENVNFNLIASRSSNSNMLKPNQSIDQINEDKENAVDEN
jgi:hypothetical protein